MILSDDGKYYLDLEKKKEYDRKTHEDVIKYLFDEKGYMQIHEEYLLNEKDITFKFTVYYDDINVESNLNINRNSLRRYPIQLIITYSEDKKEEIDIYSKEQFEKILKNKNISYPVINSFILTEQLKNCIFDCTYNIKVEIMNMQLNELYNEKKETKEVFGKFSKYINLYMKSGINFNNYPEQKYYKEKDFIINKDDSLDFYYSNNGGRAQMTEKIKSSVKNGLNYFITGPHGIGKTFTLFGALSILSINEKFKYIYINLDILNKQKNKMEILLYEAKNLFKNEKDYISAFKYLKDTLNIPSLLFPLSINFLDGLHEEILLIIIHLIEYIDLNIEKDNTKYAIVIDQFKYENDSDYISELILKLKVLIEKKNNFSLIVCSSFNYSGIKDNLISVISKEKSKIKFPFEFQNKLCDKPNIKKESQYLKLFGYLPRYCQIQKMIDKKYVNLMKKIVKKKFKSFYDKECDENYNMEDFMILQLKWIKENIEKKLSKEQLLDFIRKNPIKYFYINLESKSFDYLFPLIETIIDELIKSKELKDYIRVLYNESERGWYFEHELFDKIENENIFLNYYIENTIIIKSIFKKEKIENFDKNANTLFCFSISNVKRYDGIIYIPESESILFLQASIHKPESKLAKYTKENIKEDIKKIEKKFFKPNKISPKKYYLIFILDSETYRNNPGYMKELNKFNFHYCFYDPKNNLIDYQYIKDYKLNEIGFNPYDISGEEEQEEENPGFFFLKADKFIGIEENKIQNKPGYYYVEKGIDLLSFLDETCMEYDKIINMLYEKENYYSRFRLKSFIDNYCFFPNSNEQNKQVIIALINKSLIFGESIHTKNSKTSYKWTKYSRDWFEVEIKQLDEKESKFIKSMSGFFIFEGMSIYL